MHIAMCVCVLIFRRVVGKKHVTFTVRYEDGKMVLPDEQDVDLKELLSGRVIQGMEEGESSEGGEGSEDGESSEDGEDGESSEDGEGGESGSDGSGYESDLDSEGMPVIPHAGRSDTSILQMSQWTLRPFPLCLRAWSPPQVLSCPMSLMVNRELQTSHAD